MRVWCLNRLTHRSTLRNFIHSRYWACPNHNYTAVVCGEINNDCVMIIILLIKLNHNGPPSNVRDAQMSITVALSAVLKQRGGGGYEFVYIILRAHYIAVNILSLLYLTFYMVQISQQVSGKRRLEDIIIIGI